MKHFVGLDVSVKETAVCLVDESGRICREVKVVSHRASVSARHLAVVAMASLRAGCSSAERDVFGQRCRCDPSACATGRRRWKPWVLSTFRTGEMRGSSPALPTTGSSGRTGQTSGRESGLPAAGGRDRASCSDGEDAG
ncbi:hypothetical protein FJ930_28305 [Mesorhizobium sp. B2-4-15]|nr:hypothetical protein FJ930_28305 [Mesorhizobium sp. B2-4-15]